MDRVRRHLKSLTVAVAAVALSAGLVAGHEMPGAADDGLATAAQAAQKTVPVEPPVVEPEVPVVEEPVVEEEPLVEEEELDEVEGERPQNHGWFVSQAANAATPDGFSNHGEYVSSVARGDEGMPEAAAAGKAKADAAPGQAKAAAAKAKAGGGG